MGIGVLTTVLRRGDKPGIFVDRGVGEIEPPTHCIMHMEKFCRSAVGALERRSVNRAGGAWTYFLVVISTL